MMYKLYYSYGNYNYERSKDPMKCCRYGCFVLCVYLYLFGVAECFGLCEKRFVEQAIPPLANMLLHAEQVCPVRPSDGANLSFNCWGGAVLNLQGLGDNRVKHGIQQEAPIGLIQVPHSALRSITLLAFGTKTEPRWPRGE